MGLVARNIGRRVGWLGDDPGNGTLYHAANEVEVHWLESG